MDPVTLFFVLLPIAVVIYLLWAILAVGAEADERDEEMYANHK